MSLCESISSNPHYELLSNRTRKRLDGNGIYSLADLIEWDGSSLLQIRGFGVGCLDEVNAFLASNGFLPVPMEGNDLAPSARALRGYAALSEKASTVLSDAGIHRGQDLQGITVQDVLNIPDVNDSVVDEIVTAGFIPQARDPQDLLLLLSASETLRSSLSDLTDSYLDTITQCQSKVKEQIRMGVLHEQAGVDCGAVQSINQKMKPPARTLTDLLFRLQYLSYGAAESFVSKLNGINLAGGYLT